MHYEQSPQILLGPAGYLLYSEVSAAGVSPLTPGAGMCAESERERTSRQRGRPHDAYHRRAERGMILRFVWQLTGLCNGTPAMHGTYFRINPKPHGSYLANLQPPPKPGADTTRRSLLPRTPR